MNTNSSNDTITTYLAVTWLFVYLGHVSAFFFFFLGGGGSDLLFLFAYTGGGSFANMNHVVPSLWFIAKFNGQSRT